MQLLSSVERRLPVDSSRDAEVAGFSPHVLIVLVQRSTNPTIVQESLNPSDGEQHVCLQTHQIKLFSNVQSQLLQASRVPNDVRRHSRKFVCATNADRWFLRHENSHQILVSRPDLVATMQVQQNSASRVHADRSKKSILR